MARRDDIHEFVNSLNSNTNSSSSNTNSNCNGNGKFWIIPEQYHTIKYVTILGKTKFKPAGGLPFIKFPWRKNIEIIDKRDNIINLPQINDFKTKDGVTVVADLYIQYSITNVEKFISNQINLKEKLTENIKAIMQQYFRNNDSDIVAHADISIDSIGRDKFISLENQYGIHFTQFAATKIKLPEIDDDKTKRIEMKLRMETKQEQLELQKAQLELEREIAKYRTETDNIVREEHIKSILKSISTYPKNIQAVLLERLYGLDILKNSNGNINYFIGAENIGPNSNNHSRRR